MNNLELAYLAGVIDSDGYIGVGRRHSVKGRREYFVARVTIKQREPEAIDLAATLGGYTATERFPNDPRRHPIYRWTVSTQEAIGVLRQVLPYLRIKRAQAENAIAMDEARGSYVRKGIAKGLPYMSVEKEAELRLFYERGLVLNAPPGAKQRPLKA